MSRPRSTAAAWTDLLRAGRLRPAAVAAVLALLLGLAGCGGGDDQNDQVGRWRRPRQLSPRRSPRSNASSNQRARAVRDHDLGLFLRRVDHQDAALMARQRRYFRNLVQLPLARFSYKVTSEQWDGPGHGPELGRRRVHPAGAAHHAARATSTPCPSSARSGSCSPSDNGRATLVSDRTSHRQAAVPAATRRRGTSPRSPCARSPGCSASSTVVRRGSAADGDGGRPRRHRPARPRPAVQLARAGRRLQRRGPARARVVP